MRSARPICLILILILLGVCGGLMAAEEPAVAPQSVNLRHDGLAPLVSRVPVGGAVRLEEVALFEDGPPAALELRRVEAFSSDASILLHGEQGTRRIPVPKNRYFRGRIAGESGSLALVTVLERGGLRGLVARGADTWVLESAAPHKSLSAEVEVRQLDAELDLPGGHAGFDCRVEELGGNGLGMPTGLLDALGDLRDLERASTSTMPAERAGLSGHTARVAIETDYEYLQRFSGNAAAATDYIGDLFAFASGIYSDEVDTSLLVSSVDLWSTSSDPWTETSTSCGLYQFGRYWNDNRSGNVRTIAHFLSGKSSSSGIAWVGVLCQGGFNVNIGTSCPDLTPEIDNYGGGYGFTSGISGSFNINNPGVVWDIVAVTHEIGHNFNSPHTHCYGGLGVNANPVDQCYGGQCGSPGCYCGTPTLPCGSAGAGCGTIMSYCHLLYPGGLGNLTLTFGQGHPYGVAPGRVPTRMNDHVLSRASYYPSCLAPESTSEIFSDSFESGDSSSWP